MVWHGNNPKSSLISAAWSMVLWSDVDEQSFCLALEIQFVHADSIPFFLVPRPLATDILKSTYLMGRLLLVPAPFKWWLFVASAMTLASKCVFSLLAGHIMGIHD